MRISDDEFARLSEAKRPLSAKDNEKWVHEYTMRSLESRIKNGTASNEDTSAYMKLRTYDEIEFGMVAAIFIICAMFFACVFFAFIG